MAQKPWIVPIPGTTQMPHMIETIGGRQFDSWRRTGGAEPIRFGDRDPGARLPDAVSVFSGVEAPPKQ